MTTPEQTFTPEQLREKIKAHEEYLFNIEYKDFHTQGDKNNIRMARDQLRSLKQTLKLLETST
jgi:hypothetical protein